MINSNSVIVYSPSIPKKTISLLLCICINYSAVAQPDISCVSSMPNVSIKRDTINDVDNLLQRTFDGKAEGRRRGCRNGTARQRDQRQDVGGEDMYEHLLSYGRGFARNA